MKHPQTSRTYITILSIDAFERFVDRMAGGQRRDRRHQYDLAEYSEIAGYPNGCAAEQRRCFVAACGACHPGIGCPDNGEQYQGAAAADCAAFKTEGKKVALELPCDKAVGNKTVTRKTATVS